MIRSDAAARRSRTGPGVPRKPGRPSFVRADKNNAERFDAAICNISLICTSAVPLWKQLAEQLEAVIRQGGIQPHSRIPSEEALAARFGVSRPVIRHALQNLASRGIVVKLHRKGVFVGDPKPETDFITTNLAAYDDLVARGHKVTTKTFEFYRTAADEHERRALQLKEEDTVVRILRGFWMDDKPVSHALVSFRGDKVPGLENFDIEGQPILRHIQQAYGRRLTRAERWLKAVLPPSQVAIDMGVRSDLPMIWVESIAYEADNSPLEYYRAHYNSEAALIHLSVID